MFKKMHFIADYYLYLALDWERSLPTCCRQTKWTWKGSDYI